jgi:hypothetical protein
MLTLPLINVSLRNFARMTERVDAIVRQHLAVLTHARTSSRRTDLVLTAISREIRTARILHGLTYRESTTRRQGERNRRQNRDPLHIRFPSK